MEIQREKNRVVELTNEAKKLNELSKVHDYTMLGVVSMRLFSCSNMLSSGSAILHFRRQCLSRR